MFVYSGDAVLDMAEYTDGMHCYGYTESEAHQAFEKFAGVSFISERYSISQTC